MYPSPDLRCFAVGFFNGMLPSTHTVLRLGNILVLRKASADDLLWSKIRLLDSTYPSPVRFLGHLPLQQRTTK